MTNENEVIKIEGTEIEITVGSVAEDLGLLFQMEQELDQLQAKINERIESKVAEHIDHADACINDFIAGLDPEKQQTWKVLNEQLEQHEKNMMAGVESITENSTTAHKEIADQIKAQKESIKPLIIAHGSTIKGPGKMGVYVSGSRKADLKKLDKHITSLIKADKFESAKFFTEMIDEGKPSVTFRKHKLDSEVE